MLATIFLSLLAACATSKPGTAAEVPFDATLSGSSAASVQAALDELYVRCRADGSSSLPAAAPGGEAGLAALAERVRVLEEKVARLEESGLTVAAEVSYDPRATTLDARTLQAAVDELAARVENAQRPDMGQPGAALFELRDKHGNLVQGDGGQGREGGAGRGGRGQPMPGGQGQPMPGGQGQPMPGGQGQPMPGGQGQPMPGR